MPNLAATILFWAAVLAVLIGQLGILRSTARAWRRSAAPVPVTERVFAWAPAIALLVVLYLAWGEATKPPVFEVEFDPRSQEIRL